LRSARQHSRLLAAIPSIGYAKSLIPWIYAPWWLPAIMVVPSLFMCSLASICFGAERLTVDRESVPCLIISWSSAASISFGKGDARVLRCAAFH